MLGVTKKETNEISYLEYNGARNNSNIFGIIDLLKCALAESKKSRNKELTYIISMAILSAEESKKP